MVYNSVVQILDAASETGPSPAVALYNCFTTEKIDHSAVGIEVAPELNLHGRFEMVPKREMIAQSGVF